MTAWRLTLASLRHHWRAHVGVALGATVGAAVLIGALVVGDCVRYSLARIALLRLGAVTYAMQTHDRFFRVALAEQIAAAWSQSAAVVQLAAVAATLDGSARANDVQLLGVDDRFWSLAPDIADDAAPQPKSGEALINAQLAQQLGVQVGDTIVLRIAKPSMLPRDMPLAEDSDAVALRLAIVAIADDGAFGRFGLHSNQVPPFNLFVNRNWLASQIDLAGRANLMLTDGMGENPADAMRKAFDPEDAQVQLRTLHDGSTIELRTDRVFLDRKTLAPALAHTAAPTSVLSYFVNELRRGDRTTPYSVVCATDDAGLVPADLAADQIILTDWLAKDLGAKVGDEISLRYFTMTASRKLIEESRTFSVHSVIPVEGAAADPTLMPEFPGLAQADNCRDWNPGIPIDLDRIREKDETWWSARRGTPKAYIRLDSGTAMWSNRYGDLTAVRWHAADQSADGVGDALRQHLQPEDFGLFFQDVRSRAHNAAGQSMDFGGLFIGLSFFLIVAAILLTAMLFAFGVEQRATQIGTLLAIGWTPGMVLRVLMFEGGVLAAIGSVAGAFLGLAYTHVVIGALRGVWRDAVAAAPILFHVEPVTVLIGMIASVLVATLAIGAALRREVRRPARELLAMGAERADHATRGGSRLRIAVAVACLVASACILASAGDGRDAAGAFFGGGAMILIAMIVLLGEFLGFSPSCARPRAVTLGMLGVRNSGRRRGRSMATVAMLACGCFLVITVGANRHSPADESHDRAVGTGGFTLYAEASLPVTHDLRTPEGRESLGLPADVMTDVQVVPMRLRRGDDASCLNLNRAQQPRLLGIATGELAARGAFSFSSVIAGQSRDDGWGVLEGDLGGSDDAIPAVGDAASVTWAMGKRVGETITYTDEFGRPFDVRIVGVIANSILQGGLLISEQAFERKFPSESGHRTFLIETSTDKIDQISALLTRSLADYGLEVTPTARRLAMFSAVENTYLSIFQILGGLGVLMGSVGLGVVVLRNVLERRGEFAMLRAIGFSRRQLRRLVFSEHAFLLLCGLLIGGAAAMIAVIPSTSHEGQTPLLVIAGLMSGIFACGLLWVALASRAAMSGELMDGLRSE